MRLAQATRPDQDQGAGLLNERTVKEAHHDGTLEFGTQREVELLQGGGEGEAGRFELAADLVLLATDHLLGEQLVEELAVAHALLLGMADPLGVDIPDARQFELGQLVVEARRRGWGGAHRWPPARMAPSSVGSRLATYAS